MGAERFAHRRLGELSGGERQRLLLAQALVGRPRLLLLDEPLANLDVRAQTVMAELVSSVARQRSITVVLVAHDLNPLRRVLDRVCYVAGGGVVIGSPEEIVTGPVLSRLYGAPVEVLVDSRGRRFVVGLEEEVAHPHPHDHGDAGAFGGVSTVTATTAPAAEFGGSPAFSWNLYADFAQMWSYPFFQHAFEAGTIVAVVAGVIGYFVVLRRVAFAAHALSHIGFAGAAGAVALSINPLWGLLVFCVSSGAVIGALGQRLRSRDTVIGIVLAFALGLGALFLSLYQRGRQRGGVHPLRGDPRGECR